MGVGTNCRISHLTWFSPLSVGMTLIDLAVDSRDGNLLSQVWQELHQSASTRLAFTTTSCSDDDKYKHKQKHKHKGRRSINQVGLSPQPCSRQKSIFHWSQVGRRRLDLNTETKLPPEAAKKRQWRQQIPFQAQFSSNRVTVQSSSRNCLDDEATLPFRKW